ncbi:hypothetical protein CRG98_018904 [Punica granatum]|uniref:Retrotransposon Copia-like N-terminal domain-containing protein n=1 Tax=Punica granatum TaxID=22663 RepID=A0A2I0JWM8_PUNGR|nr:hypothetical protein CRG98_018904 [Punica granatum]
MSWRDYLQLDATRRDYSQPVRDGTRLFAIGRGCEARDWTWLSRTDARRVTIMISMKSMNHLSCILSDNRFPRPNFSDWLHNLNIVLNMEALGYILETQEIELPGGDATSDQQNAYDQWSIDDMKVRCYMLASMSNEMQKQHENMKSSREILKNLRELYGESSRTARYEIS